MKKLLLILLLIGIFIVNACTENLPRACTDDAKVCPDGSLVSRNFNNNCEFDPCPTVGNEDDGIEDTPIEPPISVNCKDYSYSNCPDSCETGPSCSLCADVGCHEQGYKDDWETISDEEPECLAEGGEWKPAGLLGIPRCIHTFEDGGNVCESSDDCLGDCLVNSDGEGYCKYDDNPFGCSQTIESYLTGGPAICVD